MCRPVHPVFWSHKFPHRRRRSNALLFWQIHAPEPEALTVNARLCSPLRFRAAGDTAVYSKAMQCAAPMANRWCSQRITTSQVPEFD